MLRNKLQVCHMSSRPVDEFRVYKLDLLAERPALFFGRQIEVLAQRKLLTQFPSICDLQTSNSSVGRTIRFDPLPPPIVERS